PLLHNSVQSVLGDMTPYYSLALWHGFNIPLIMSFVALGGGVLFYTVLRVRFNLTQIDRVPVLYRFNGKQAYETIMLELRSAASRLERLLGTRRLQPQLVLIVSVCLFAGLATAASAPEVWSALRPSTPHLPFTALWLIGCVCAVAAAWQAKYHRLAALALVGGAGLDRKSTRLNSSH